MHLYLYGGDAKVVQVLSQYTSRRLHVCISRSLQVPAHMTVLHVEQEVTGDDTMALDSVLECDVKRHRLLVEEKSINAALQANR